MARSVVFNLIGNNRTSGAFRGAARDADHTADRVDRLGDSAEGTSRRLGLLGRESDRAGSRLQALTGRTATLVSGLLAVAPAAQAAAAAAVAGAGAMAAAYGAAGAAVGAFYAAVKPQVQGIGEVAKAYDKAQEQVQKYGAGSKQAQAATKAYKQELAGLPPATRDTAKAFLGLRGDYKKWSDSLAGDTMPIFTRGINAARQVLPKFTPLVKTAARELNTFVDGIARGAKGKGLDAFIAKVNRVAGPVLGSFLRSAKNVAKGVLGIFEAFLPHAPAMASGIEGLTAKFARWGQSLKDSEGFAAFIAYVRANLPALTTTFGNLVQIVVNLATAFAPMTGISLMLVKNFTAMLAALPPPVVTALAYAFVAASTAAKVWVPIQTALNVALSANPIGLVVLAIAGLVAGMVVAYNRSETFRAVVQGAWRGIQTVASTAWTQHLRPALTGMKGLFQGAHDTWQRLWPGLRTILEEAASFLAGTLKVAVDQVSGALGAMGFNADTASGKIAGIGRGFKATQQDGQRFLSWSTIFGAVLGQIFGGFTGAILGGLAGYFWPQVKTLFRQGFGQLKQIGQLGVTGLKKLWTDYIPWTLRQFRQSNVNLVRAAGDLMRRLYQTVFGGLPPLRNTWSSLWTWLWAFTRRQVSTVVGGIRRFLSDSRNAFATGAAGIRTAWDRLRGYTKAPVNFMIGVVFNKGIVGLWNRVMGWLHIDGMRLGKLPLLASGGTLANPAPVQPMMTNGPMAIVGEGNPRYPEYVIPTDPKFRGRAQGLWAAAGRDLLSGGRNWLTGAQALGGEGIAFAAGGIIGDVLGGIKKGASKVLNIGKAALDLIAHPEKIWDRMAAPVLAMAKGTGAGPWNQAIGAIPGKLMGVVRSAALSVIKAFNDGFGGGGGPGVQRALAWARTQAGKPYIWGGVGPGGYDCSGWWSALTNVIRGRNPFSRLFSTHSFGATSGPGGFVRNLASAVRVGITDAGVGHMAGTLGRTNTESSGSYGVRVGGGARGWNDGLFTRWYGLKFDDGGMLQPGWNIAYNGLGRPEPVFPSTEAAAAYGTDRRPVVNITVGPVYVTEAADVDMLAARLEFLIGGAAY